jgi:DNA-directed RNA polymerase specialized sigma24 family protein
MIGGICNAARSYWRKNDAEREVFCDATPCQATPDDALLNSGVRNTLLSAVLSRLGESCRETLHRFYIGGESATSIADSRTTTQNSILRLLNYCRGRARDAYRAMNEVS